jgi:hypothetical protein
MVQPTIPPGYDSINTPDGLKITNDGGQTLLLIDPSDDYLKALAFNTLRDRSEATERAEFPGGYWERVNDYSGQQRNYTEFDDSGAAVGNTSTPISDEEVETRRTQGFNEQFLADVNALSPDPVQAALLNFARGVGPLTRPTFIVKEFQVAPNGSTVSVPIRLERTIAGLSGFVMTAEFPFKDAPAQTHLAKFTNVTFPPAFGITSFAPNPVDGPELTSVAASDIGSSVEGRNSDVLLCTLEVELLRIGASPIQIRFTTLDDDNGEPIRVNPITIIVRAT